VLEVNARSAANVLSAREVLDALDEPGGTDDAP